METSEELELSRLEEETLDVDDTDDNLELWLLLISLPLSDTAEVEVDEPKLVPNDVVAVEENRELVEIKSEEDDTEEDEILSETDEATDDDEKVIGVVVGIDGSNLVEEEDEEDTSVIPIDGSAELLEGFEVPVTGSMMPDGTVKEPLEDDLE